MDSNLWHAAFEASALTTTNPDSKRFTELILPSNQYVYNNFEYKKKDTISTVYNNFFINYMQ